MYVYEQKLEMRGMRRSEILNYFIHIGAQEVGKGVFKGLEWTVEVGSEAFVSLGRLEIPATVVVFKSLEISVLDKAVSAFRLRFLSAGG